MNNKMMEKQASEPAVQEVKDVRDVIPPGTKYMIKSMAGKIETAVQAVKGVKDVIPPKTRRMMRSLVGKGGNYSVTLRDGRWVAYRAKKYEKELMRPLAKSYSTNIDKQRMFPVMSMARDKVVENELCSGRYTFTDMLVILNPYEITPLTALALFDTNEPCKVKFTVKGIEKKKKNGEVLKGDSISGMTDAALRHRVPIFGLYPNAENVVILELLDEQGEVLEKRKLTIRTEPLPAKLRKMVKVVKSKRASKAGLIFVYGGETPRPYAFDSQGVIRYYLNRKPRGYGLHPMANGRFLFADKNILAPNYANPHTTQVYEMDLFGRTFHVYNIKNGLHHDAFEMEKGGNYLAAGSSLLGYNEDTVIEIDRETGKQVREFNVAAVFDETYKDSIDWAHINTVSYNPENNCALICCRNLHTVAEIDWGSSELKWILCNPDFWKGTSMEERVLKPVGEVQWHYQAHAAYELPEDLDGNPDTRHFIIYDNHWHKRRSVPFFDGDDASYVRIYTVNEKEMTVSMLKNFPSAKSKIRSNGLLMADCDRLMVMSGYLEPPVDGYMGMVYEYRYTTEKLLRQYATRKSYYRAYELWADYKELAKPMPLTADYVRGSLKPFEKIEKPVWEEVKDLPRAGGLGSAVLTEEDEASRSYDIVDGKQDGEEIVYEKFITFFLREDILYVRAKDHLVEKLYLSGQNNSYVYDTTNTDQHNEALFGMMAYCVAMPLDNIESDSYKIYIQTPGGVYDTKKHIRCREQEIS